ncbi:MAG: M56 family metallopeptidase [Bacteroidaceae bacterium]|nr:M56 family metallopeptidase [Bacteroidaceae bacterium]
MEAFLIYQLKVALLAAALFLLYKLLLARQTFHGFNRAMLLLICVLSLVMPFCYIQGGDTVSRIRDRLGIAALAGNWELLKEPEGKANSDGYQIHGTMYQQDEQTLADATLNSQVDMAGSRHRTETAELAETIQLPAHQPLTARRILAIVLFAAWCIGFIWVAVSKVISLISLRRVISEGRYADRLDECDLLESEHISQPMNWMHCILMPRDWMEKENMAVWKHEMSHASKSHSLDMLLVDLMQIFQWFNPVMLLLNKEIEMIHEFEADRAVLESGADARQYKLTLVSAVAKSRGLAMTSWLRQTNLKKRIDMMQRKKSNRWNRLRALFIPVVTVLFLLLNVQITNAQNQNDGLHWPVFEDGKVWIFKDGTAKVQTFDHVTANMKVDQVAEYLKNYEGYKTTRMTLMYTYDIDGLAQAQPLAEQLLKAGIRINVANNEGMLQEMTMPEYRLVRIYGPEKDGQYRFEMNCNNHQVRLMHLGSDEPYPYKDLSISGDTKLMLKWIDLFDGHGLAIYPAESMPNSDLQKFADAAWSRGVEQVSVVQKENGRITLIPQGTNMTKEFGNVSVIEAVNRMNAMHTDFENSTVIEHPQFSYNSNSSLLNVVKVVRCSDKTAIIYQAFQGPDLWITDDDNDGILKCDGKEYRQTGGYGLEGFEHKYFWSPDFGQYVFVDYYPALPADAKVVDVCNAAGNAFIKNLQVSNSLPEGFYDQFVNMAISGRYMLKTLDKVDNDDAGYDNFNVSDIEFTDSETSVRCGMSLAQSPTFPGYINDFKLIFPDGTEMAPIRVEGVPVGQDFNRGGDFVANHFQIIFPKLDPKLFRDGENVIRLTGIVCHEPVEVILLEPERILYSKVYPDKIEPGEYDANVLVLENWKVKDLCHLENFTVGKDGTISVKGDTTGKLKDGKYKQKPVTDSNKFSTEDINFISLSLKGKSIKFLVTAELENDKLSTIQMIPVPDNVTDFESYEPEWVLLLNPLPELKSYEIKIGN